MDEEPKPTAGLNEPYILPGTVMREFTLRAVVVGAVLGIVFGASSLYLALKVGITVSASIPVAVISLALFRGLSKLGVRDSTILENNITQTAGSAGESIAFGVAVTMPAILILGFDMELARVLLVSVLGGLLGILMMIPLRRSLIVREHCILKYPEGTACAAVLVAGANAADRAAQGGQAARSIKNGFYASGGPTPSPVPYAGGKVIFTGFFTGMLYKVLNVAARGWKDVPQRVFGAPFQGGSVAVEVSPELLGVGYIIGPRIASLMCGGGVLAYLVLIPLIRFFGEKVAGPVAPGTIPIAAMSPGQIRGAYILYIGAGAVAAGGIISLIRSLPTIWHGLRSGLRGQAARSKKAGFFTSGGLTPSIPRTERDIPLRLVGIGIIILIAGITAAPALHMNLLGALLIVVFGFLFVTVSSRLTGEIGSSSNPISGMTVATLLLTCVAFLLAGWTGGAHYVTALSVGAIVCIAAGNAGSTSQDLKTGYILGSTPRYQQIAILLGAFASALALGPVLLRLNAAATIYVPAAQAVPGGLRTDPSLLTQRERLAGPQARDDAAEYLVWHRDDPAGGAAEKYLVDPSGRAVWLVDPGINGRFTQRPDGSTVTKFDAPKAVLMSYIIKGILDHRLPWTLVLLGVMISVVLELCGLQSLAFAVGVYLPLSSSTPILVGGLVRRLVDWHQRRKLRHANLSAEQLDAEADKSPGVLLASGYIAGGAIAGIAIAFLAGLLEPVDRALGAWSSRHNPLFAGPHADALSMIPFIILIAFLYLAGREKILRA
jgi:putative OPT family oligopeptide transporter